MSRDFVPDTPGDDAQIVRRMSDLHYLMERTCGGNLEGLLEDFRTLPPHLVANGGPLEIAAAFFRERAHILRRGNEGWPAHKILLQLAVEHADDSPITIAAEQWLAEGRCDWLWLRRVPRLPHAEKNPCLMVLEGHTRCVHGARLLADGRLLSWSQDGTLRMWDAHGGVCLRVLQGHSQLVLDILPMADGRLLSWSLDNTLRLWDPQRGDCLVVLEGHHRPVAGALVLDDGRLISWSWDKTLRMWDAQSGAPLAFLEGHTERVNGALVLTDGSVLSWGDRTLRIWDIQSGGCLAVLEGHTRRITGALVLADGRLLS